MSTVISSIDLEPIKKQLAKVEQDMKDPTPTPPVGTSVIWFAGARNVPGNERAAIVTQVEGPGQVVLIVFAPNAMPTHNHKGVLHITDVVHDRRSKSVSSSSGSWDYPGHARPPKADYKYHKDILEKKRDLAERQLIQAAEIKGSQEDPEFPQGDDSAE